MTEFLHHHRITDPETLDTALIDRELAQGGHVIVQFSQPGYGARMLRELDELCARYDERFGVRFFSHYADDFDCRVLRQIPNVKTLYVDVMPDAVHQEAIAELRQLQLLGLGIYNLRDAEILGADALKQLRTLILFDQRIAVNLAHLREYSRLRRLYVGGKIKQIEAIGSAAGLEFLSLNSVSPCPLGFVNKLDKLKTLKFILGGREDLNDIGDNAIETLEIARVRGFRELRNLANFKRLRRLTIEDQIRLPELHIEARLDHLEELKIINCKTFGRLTGLANLPALRHLRIARTALDFDTLIRQPLPDALEIFAFYTMKAKVDKEIERKLLELGYRLMSQRDERIE